MVNEGQSNEKRRRILQAAADVFSQKGFYRAKIEEIAAAADVGKGTVYEYFTSKNDLFEQMIKYFHEEYLNNLEGLRNNRTSAVGKLEEFIRTNLAFIGEHRDLLRVLMDEPLESSEQFKVWMHEFYGKMIACVSEIIAAGQRGGEFRNCSSRIAAGLLLGMMNGICVSKTINWGEARDDEIIKQGMEIILYGLCANQQTAAE